MIADRDPFAYAGEPKNQDAEILALFYGWLAVCEERDRIDDDDEAAINDNDRRMLSIERAIAASCGGAVSLAVKAFIDCRRSKERWTPKTAQLRFFGDCDCDSDLYASLLRDAAMIVPEIAS